MKFNDLPQLGADLDDIDLSCTKAGNVHLTRESAQEHADALRKINTQGAV